MKNIFAAILMVGLSGAVFAGGANSDAYFDGFYGQVEVGLGSQTNQIGELYNGSSASLAYGNTSPQFGFAVGYSKKVLDLPGDNDINLALNLLYNATNGNSGTDKYTYGSNSGFFSTNTKNIYAVSLEPGYYLSKHGLGYLKIGYASGQSSITTDNSSTGFGRQSGLLFGFGFKHGLNAAHPNIFWGLEAYQINFSSKTITDSSTGVQWTSKPTLLFGKVNLGYMF